jgi:hypothetical protein
MVFDMFKKAFSQQPANTPLTPTPPAKTPEPFFIPHAEEPMNPVATLANTDPIVILNKWLTDWETPAQYWDYWKQAINIRIYAIYPADILAMGIKQDTPAATWEDGGKRQMVIKPQWLNPGVIAHEQAHNSYALLNPSQKSAFASVFTSLKDTDPLMKFLFSKNAYGLTNDIEGHAEVYRYIGQYMSTRLKPFYPQLF